MATIMHIMLAADSEGRPHLRVWSNDPQAPIVCYLASGSISAFKRFIKENKLDIRKCFITPEGSAFCLQYDKEYRLRHLNMRRTWSLELPEIIQ